MQDKVPHYQNKKSRIRDQQLNCDARQPKHTTPRVANPRNFMPTGIWLSVRPLAIESIYSLSLKHYRVDDIITADPDFPEGSKNYDLAHEFLVKVLLGN
jgi:hypothetical protein